MKNEFDTFPLPVLDLEKIKESNYKNLDSLHPYYRKPLFFQLASALNSPIYAKYYEFEGKQSEFIKEIEIVGVERDEAYIIGFAFIKLLDTQYKFPVTYPTCYQLLETEGLKLIGAIPTLPKKIKVLKALIHYTYNRGKNHSNTRAKNIFYEVRLNLIVKLQALENLLSLSNKEQEKGKTIDLPYKIALLKEIGFFDLPLLKNLPATKKIKVIKQIIGGTDRQIKGNINVLNPQSLEDRTRYTSFAYEDEVKKFVSNLFNI